MKMSKTEETRGVRYNDGSYYCYAAAPILCRDSKTGRDLHRDKMGKYFLHTPNMTGRPSITPLTIEQARQIVERDGTAEQYAKLFRGERKGKIDIDISGVDLDRLDEMANADRTTRAGFVRRLIRAEYRRRQKREAEQKRSVLIRTADMNEPLREDE